MIIMTDFRNGAKEKVNFNNLNWEDPKTWLREDVMIACLLVIAHEAPSETELTNLWQKLGYNSLDFAEISLALEEFGLKTFDDRKFELTKLAQEKIIQIKNTQPELLEKISKRCIPLPQTDFFLHGYAYAPNEISFM